jgi:hypothetical protein
MCVTTSNGEESSPTRTIIGDNRPNESASTTTTTTNSPSQAVPATRQRTRTTTEEKRLNQEAKTKKGSEIFYVKLFLQPEHSWQWEEQKGKHRSIQIRIHH